MKKYFLTIVLFILTPVLLFGQAGLTIKGTITDANGEPLIGANVFISALSVGSATDSDGSYEFEIPSSFVNGQQVLITAAYVGYKKQVESIVLRGNSLNLNFTLEEDIFESEVVVVTGIASKTSKAIADVAVSRVSASELTAKQNYGGISDLVSGKIAGVQVKQATGNVGGGWSFYVRGGGGLNGDEQPIVYIDGTRVNNAEVVGYWTGGQGISTLSTINPNDIESIEILKGPAAAAMYGTNASNGVVLITTKSGKLVPGGAAPISVAYKFSYGMNTPSFKYDSDLYALAARTDNLLNDVPIRDHYINISGGSSTVRYYGSFQNRSENGILLNNSLDRNTARLNMDLFPSEDFSLKLNSTYSSTDIARPPTDNSLYSAISNVILYYYPWEDVDSAAIANIKDKTKTKQFVGSAQLTWKPIKDFEVSAQIGIDQSGWRQDQYYPYGYQYLGDVTGGKNIFELDNTQLLYNLNARYSYTLMDDLLITSIVGTQIFDRRRETHFTSAKDFSTNLMPDIGQAVTLSEKGESSIHTRDAGIYTENSISYLDQYFLTLGLRRDYASSISTDAPAITYPKIGFALRVDKYNNLLPNFINLLKVRAAYGESGQLPGSRAAIPLLWTALTGGYGGAGAVLSSIGNKFIEPERIKEFEFGFDAELLNMLSAEFSLFTAKATKSIVSKNLAPSTGLTASAKPINVGEIDSWGFESLIQFQLLKEKDYDLNFSLIWNYQKNEVKNISSDIELASGIEDEISSGVNVIKAGLPKYEFYDYATTGAEFNTDGTYRRAARTSEKVALGNPIPNHTGSFTINFRFLRNFSFYALTEWALNFKVYNQAERWAIDYGAHKQHYILKAKLGLLAPWDDYDYIPADIVPYTPGTEDYIRTANEFAKLDKGNRSNFIRDADYFAIREISLSYDCTDMLKEYNAAGVVKNLVLGISIRNLARFSKIDGQEFETNESGSRTSVSKGIISVATPLSRTYNFWVSVGL